MKGDFNAAAEMAGQAVKGQPQSGIARLWFSRALFGQGQTGRAESELAAVAKANPKSAQIDALSGDIYWSRKDLPRARASYTRALETRPDSFDALVGLTKVDLFEKKPDAAKARLEARLEKAPSDLALLNLAGTTFTATGDVAKAEETFKRAIQADPSNFEGYRRLSVVYMMQNKLEDAKKDLEQALAAKPETAVASRTMLGIIFDMQKNPQEARKQYEQVVALDPQAAVAANNLAWNYADSGNANLDQALALAQTAVAAAIAQAEHAAGLRIDTVHVGVTSGHPQSSTFNGHVEVAGSVVEVRTNTGYGGSRIGAGRVASVVAVGQKRQGRSP